MSACFATGVGRGASCGEAAVAFVMPACSATGVGMDACCTGADAVASGMPACFPDLRFSLFASIASEPGCMGTFWGSAWMASAVGGCCVGAGTFASCTGGAACIGPGGCPCRLANSGTGRSPEASRGSGPRKAHGMYGMPCGKPCPSSVLILATGAGEATTCVSAMASS